MFQEGFMDFGGDFNRGRASDHRFLPDSSSGGFLRSLDTNPFPESNLDLCKKLCKMGISCDTSIWSRPDTAEDFGSRTLHGFDQSYMSEEASRIYNVPSSLHQGSFLQNSSYGVSPLLGFQDSFTEMAMFPNKDRDLLFDHFTGRLNRSSPCLTSVSLANDPFKGSLMYQGNRGSRAATAMEGSFPEDTNLMSPFNEIGNYFKKYEPKRSTGLPVNIASMVNIYGSMNVMAKDQVGCRVLQKLVEEGTFLDAKIIFYEIISNVADLSIDPFGNYLIQKLLEVLDEEHRTLIVRVLTSSPMELIKICLSTYGTRVAQKMIETVKTKQQIAMVRSGLKQGFLVLAKDLNGYHVIQSCLQSFGPNDNKFVLEAATKYCAELATHSRGCCVLQCCILNSVGAQRERLISEISRNSLHLSQDPFGNYVVQYLIEQKVSPVKLLIQFRTHYEELATQKFSSHVIEKSLRAYPESRAEIVRELLSVPNFERLLHDPFANYVIQTALSVTKGALRAGLVEKVNRFGKLKTSPYCKKILSKTFLKK